LTQKWTQDQGIAPTFARLLQQNGDDFDRTADFMRTEFDDDKKLGLKKGEIYRLTRDELIATDDDFKRAFDFRKTELQEIWKTSPKLSHLYEQLSREFKQDFLAVFRGLYKLVENKRATAKELGLQSGEIYSDPEDTARIAAIYNGIPGQRQWVPFRKGDPEGRRWITNEPLFVHWSPENVKHLRVAPEARWQGHAFFLLPGITWTLHANHVGLKARLQPPCVFDASGSRLTPIGKILSANQFLAILNSDLFSFIIKKFVKNTQDYEINDLRMAPIIVPTKSQALELETLSTWASKAKQLALDLQEPSAELVLFSKMLLQKQNAAPAYLQPDPQMQMFQTTHDCLAVIELAVNWSVEKLYDVEGLGPFNEF
jgi:hypothetical protein